MGNKGVGLGGLGEKKKTAEENGCGTMWLGVGSTSKL